MEIAVVNAGLPIVDGLSLPASHRDLLKPAERVRAADGEWRELPRYFYEVGSWTIALETPLTAHFGLWEFMDVDLREAPALRAYPRFIPCAVTALAAVLEVFRIEAGAPVRIAANGGYRSPSHGGNRVLSPHSWAAAANIYRIGADPLDSADRLERFSALARRLLPFAWIRSYGTDVGMADDHLHIDLGYVTLVPHGASEREHEALSGGDAR